MNLCIFYIDKNLSCQKRYLNKATVDTQIFFSRLIEAFRAIDKIKKLLPRENISVSMNLYCNI